MNKTFDVIMKVLEDGNSIKFEPRNGDLIEVTIVHKLKYDGVKFNFTKELNSQIQESIKDEVFAKMIINSNDKLNSFS